MAIVFNLVNKDISNYSEKNVSTQPEVMENKNTNITQSLKNHACIDMKQMLVSQRLSTSEKLALFENFDSNLLQQLMESFEVGDEKHLTPLLVHKPEFTLLLNDDLLFSKHVRPFIIDPNILQSFNQRLRQRFMYDMSKRARVESCIELIGIEKVKEIISSLTPVEISKIAPLFRLRPELYQNVAAEIQIREAGHQLGLKGDAYEGAPHVFSNFSTHRRFKSIAQKISETSGLHENDNVDFIILGNDLRNFNDLNAHGSIAGVNAVWPGHAFSFHFVREQDKTHIIYVNRGRRHELAKDTDGNVSVFTLDDTSNPRELISRLEQVLITEDKTQISQFIHQDLSPYLNETASDILKKSDQKVGNCSIANSNIVWHFKLATDLMKLSSNLSFIDAYIQTISAYKSMRMEDRANAFCTLVNLRNSNKDPNGYLDSMKQVMVKMHAKDRKNPKRQTVAFLVNQLNQQNPNGLISLSNSIINDNIPFDAADESVKLQWISEIIKSLPDGKDKLAALSYQDQCVNSFFRDFKPSRDSLMTLVQLLKVRPDVVKHAPYNAIRGLLLTASSSWEQQDLILTLLNNNLINEEFLKEIISNAGYCDADRLMPILLVRPELLQYASEYFLQEVISKRDGAIVIKSLSTEQLALIIKSLDLTTEDHQDLSSKLLDMHKVSDVLDNNISPNLNTLKTGQLTVSKLAALKKQCFELRNNNLDILEKAYKTLGLDATVTNIQLKKRYNELVLAHHPDKTSASPDALLHLAKFKKIDEAYKYIVEYRHHNIKAEQSIRIT